MAGEGLGTTMKLSIVATLYQSSPYLQEFVERTVQVASDYSGTSFEIILVNDGSPDDSLSVALELLDKYSQLTIVDLSRNFGHHKAMLAGLKQSSGEHVFLLDTDLEEEPEWLACFGERMSEVQSDVVYGAQINRKGGWFEKWSGNAFYRFFNFLTGMDLPANVTTARLMTRRYVDALLMHNESEIFIAGLWHATGFSQEPYLVEKHHSSETTYTLRKKLSQLVDSVTSFSNTPLVGIFHVGILIFIGALGYTGFLVFSRLFLEQPLSGWTSIMASIWLIGGLIISFLGVIGVYLSKVFMESKHRPNSIIRQIYSRAKE